MRNDTYKFVDTGNVIKKLMDNTNSNVRLRRNFKGKKNETALELARKKLASLIDQFDNLKDRQRIDKKNNSF